jgi:transcriptional regulator with XRE-family HTH domain
MDVTAEMAARIEGRLDRLGLSAEGADRAAGLAGGTVQGLVEGRGRVPRGAALRRLAVVLDVDEGFLLGLEPGDLIPPEMLAEVQGELGLLAPDEEALLRHYRALDVSTRAAVLLVVGRAAGGGAGAVAEEVEARKAKPRRR